MQCTCCFQSVLYLLCVAMAMPAAVAQVTVATVPAGIGPFGVAVDSVTNKTYVANLSCTSLPCPSPGTVTVIDGATNNITTVLSLIHISEPTRRTPISYAVFCLKK